MARVNWREPIRTRDGRSLTYVRTNPAGTHPVVCELEGVPHTYALDGRYYSLSLHDDPDALSPRLCAALDAVNG